MTRSDQRITVDSRPPRLRHSMLEFSRVLLEMSSTAMLSPLLRSLPRGDGHTIMTIPGFMGADGSNQRLIIDQVGASDEWAFDRMSVR